MLAFIFYLYVMSLVHPDWRRAQTAALARRVPQRGRTAAGSTAGDPEAAGEPVAARVDESVRSAIRDARAALTGRQAALPASEGRTSEPGASRRGTAVRGLAVGAGAAVAGVVTSLIRRR